MSENTARLPGIYEQLYTRSSRRGLPRRRVLCNIHASAQLHTHVNVWSVQDTDPEAASASLLENLVILRKSIARQLLPDRQILLNRLIEEK